MSTAVCVIPTRGDVDLEPVLDSIPVPTVIWNNSQREDFGVYARYMAILTTDAQVIVTQDDDLVLPRASWDALLAAYEPGKIVCNVPERFRERYIDSGMVGFGAIFDRDLAFDAFAQYVNAGGDLMNPEFQRTSDIVFTMLGGELVFVDLPYEDREFARDDSRMWRQPGHFEERDSMRQFCRQIRAGAFA